MANNILETILYPFNRDRPNRRIGGTREGKRGKNIRMLSTAYENELPHAPGKEVSPVDSFRPAFGYPRFGYRRRWHLLYRTVLVNFSQDFHTTAATAGLSRIPRSARG